MKRCILVLACVFVLLQATAARADTPNMRQSINYFMNYFNEAVVQAIHLKEYEEKEQLRKNEQHSKCAGGGGGQGGVGGNAARRRDQNKCLYYPPAGVAKGGGRGGTTERRRFVCLPV